MKIFKSILNPIKKFIDYFDNRLRKYERIHSIAIGIILIFLFLIFVIGIIAVFFGLVFLFIYVTDALGYFGIYLGKILLSDVFKDLGMLTLSLYLFCSFFLLIGQGIASFEKLMKYENRKFKEITFKHKFQFAIIFINVFILLFFVSCEIFEHKLNIEIYRFFITLWVINIFYGQIFLIDDEYFKITTNFCSSVPGKIFVIVFSLVSIIALYTSMFIAKPHYEYCILHF